MSRENERRTLERQRDLIPESREGDSAAEADRILQQRRADGWQLIAVEWQREVPPGESPEAPLVEVPYGLMVAEDGVHLTIAEKEQDAMTLMLDLLVADKPMQEVADTLNAKGFGTRGGRPFTQVDVFEMVPRLVEVAPEIFTSATWKDLRLVRKRLQALT